MHLGLVMSVFFNDDREVIVGQGSDYYDELNCNNIAVGGKCKFSVSAYVDAFFGGHYSRDNVARMLSFWEQFYLWFGHQPFYLWQN